MNEVVINNARKFAEYLSRFEIVEEVLLFGSQVNGQPHAKSDVDIGILCSDDSWSEFNLKWTQFKADIDPRIHVSIIKDVRNQHEGL